MRSVKLLLVLVVGVMFVAVPTLAVTVGPGETYQEWDFDGDANPAIPTVDVNPYGTATATINGLPGGVLPEWVAEDPSGRNGIWTSEGRLEVILEVPNQMIRNPYKEIVIEIGFFGELSGFAVYTDPFGGTVELVNRTLDVSADGWSTIIDEYYIEPNPDREWLSYHWAGDELALDYIKLATKCVPEPLTVSLLGLGALVLRRRRRAV